MKIKSKNNGHSSYIRNLERKLKRADWALKKVTVKTDNSIKKHTLKEQDVMLLDSYWKNIEITNEIAKKVINAISANINLVKRSAGNARLTDGAVKRLLVNTEEIANEVWDMNILVNDLIQEISNTEPKPDPSSPVFDKLTKVVEAVINSQTSTLESLIKILEVIQCTMILVSYLGNERCDKGISKSVLDLQKLIDISFDPDSKVKFPREDCPHDYFDITKEEYNNAKKELLQFLHEMNEYKEKKALKKAQRDAIIKSIQAAVSVGAC